MIKAILYDIMLFFALSVGALKNVNCSKATTDIQISIPPGTTVATLLLINNAENQYKLEKNKIAVIDANCNDKICINQGYISNTIAPIVCLPHKIIIKIEDLNLI